MCLLIEEVAFTRQHYGSVLPVVWWRKDHQEPLYLISNMDLKEEVCRYYQKRFKIETFFSDQKAEVFICTKATKFS
jgi:hypothetical protein